MPTYVMIATDGSGRELEITCPMDERPLWGEKRVIDGTEFQRLPSSERQEKLIVEEFDFAAFSLPPHDKDYPRVNEHGDGVFRSRAEIQTWLDKKRAQGKQVHFDRHGFK